MIKLIKKCLTLLVIALLALLPLTASRKALAASPNLISNPSAETAYPSDATSAQSWQKSSWGTNTPTYTYKTAGHTGSRSLYLAMTNYTSGDAKWVFAPVSVQPNQQYYFSDWYKSSVNTEVVAQYDDGAGNYSYQWLVTTATSATWQQSQATFTTPASAKNVTILHFINSNGWLQIDDAYLGAVTPPAASSNLVPNPSAEDTDPNNPAVTQQWTNAKWGTNTTKFTVLNTGRTGAHSLKTQITSYTDGDAKWFFPAQSVNSNQLYSFTDYYQSNAETQVVAAIALSDGTTRYLSLGNPYASPNTWTKFQSQFSMPLGAVSATVFHLISSVGYVTTDDYSLAPYAPVGFNRPLVSITFDDGWTSIYTNGLPLLQKYGLHSTQYIVLGFLNSPDEPEYMTNAQVKAFYAAGNEIGSHSMTHPDLTTLTASQLTTELRQSQNKLQNLIGVPVKNFATPFGAYNLKVLNGIKTYYGSHRSVDPGYNSRDNFDIYNIKVQNIVSTTSLAQIQAWVEQAKATNTWLVLVYHQVDTDPNAGEYNTLPSELDAQLGYIKNSGVTVETVQQALAEVSAQR